MLIHGIWLSRAVGKRASGNALHAPPPQTGLARIVQHRTGTGSSHVADFGKTRLVHAERHDEIASAIAREKLVKKWKREWKFALVEAANPQWRDLWDEWFSEAEAEG